MGKRWTPDEDKIIIERYNELGPDATAKLLGRSRFGVAHRAKLMADEGKRTAYVRRHKSPPPRKTHQWTQAENDFIRDNYHILSNGEFAVALSKPKARIAQHIRFLKNQDNWPHGDRGRRTTLSPSDRRAAKEAFIIANYPMMDLVAIAAALGLRKESVRGYITDLRKTGRWPHDGKSRPWTEAETQQLLDNVSSKTHSELAQMLRRSQNAVAGHLKRLRQRGVEMG